MLRSAAMAAEMRRRAESVLALAQAMAPVVSGDYRDSLTIFKRTTDRAVALVGSDIGYALRVEADTGTLGRAITAARS